MSQKRDEAKAFLELARDRGCVAALSGNWVVFSPPLPVELVLQAMPLSEEMASILAEQEPK